jgi:hypothetical protein
MLLWNEPIGASGKSIIRALDTQTGVTRPWTAEPAVRAGLSASDGMVLWQEVAADGSKSVMLYGVSSNTVNQITGASMDMKVPVSLVDGTLVWKAETGELVATQLRDWDVHGGRSFGEDDSQQRQNGHRAYRITDEGGIPFWSEFQRLGGESGLGRPISGRFQLADGLVYQLTERALLRWRPDRGQAELANGLQILSSLGYDQWLYSHRQVPLPASDASYGDRDAAQTTRLSWLTDPAIRSAYLAPPDGVAASAWDTDAAIRRYGLPASPPQDFGPFVAQRFERTTFQRWSAAEAQAPKDLVTPIAVGSLFRDLILDRAPDLE